MTTYVKIDPDGAVTTEATVIAEFERLMLNEGEVVILGSPLLAPYRDNQTDPYVGYVHEWGAVHGGPGNGPMPINRKAWALYGRSPIHGPILVVRDLRGPLPDEFIEMVSKPIEEWVTGDILARMNSIIEQVEA